MIFGWDVSTSYIGSCVLTDSGDHEASYYIDLMGFKDATLLEKAEFARGLIGGWYRKHSIIGQANCSYVEDKLSGFTRGRTSSQTLMKLAAFNGIISWIVRVESRFQLMGGDVHHIHPSTIKAFMRRDGLIIPKGSTSDAKKMTTLDFVTTRLGDGFPLVLTRTGNPKPFCLDMADAYCVARAGYLRDR